MKDQKADRNIVSAMVVGLYETMHNSVPDHKDDKEDKRAIDNKKIMKNITGVSSKLESELEEALVEVRLLGEKSSVFEIENIHSVSESINESVVRKLEDAVKKAQGMDECVDSVEKQRDMLAKEINRATKAANDAGGAVAGIVSRLIEAKAGITRTIEELSKDDSPETAYKKFSSALAGANGAYTNATEGKEIYDKALSMYEKAGKDGERAKKRYEGALLSVRNEAEDIKKTTNAAKNHVDRLRTAVRKNLENARREKEDGIKSGSDGVVKLEDGIKYRLAKEDEEVFVSVSKEPKHEEGEVTDISGRTETVEYDIERGIYKKHVYATVTSVAYIGATLTGRDDGYSNIGQAINAAARSATEEASRLDVNDEVNDINIDYLCAATAKETFISVYTEPVIEEQIDELKKDSITQKNGRDVVILSTDKAAGTVTYALTESVSLDSRELGIEVIYGENGEDDIDWNTTGRNIVETITNTTREKGGVFIHSSLKVAPKSKGVLGLSYLYIPTFTLSASEVHEIQIGTKFSDEKAVEKKALATLNEQANELLEKRRTEDTFQPDCLAFQSVNVENTASVAYRYDIDYSKFVMFDTEDVLISTTTYSLRPMTESVYTARVVAGLLELGNDIDKTMHGLLELDERADELKSQVEELILNSKEDFNEESFDAVLDKASTNLGVANSLLDAINSKLSDAKRSLDVVYTYEDAVKYMEEIDEEVGEVEGDTDEKPVSWIWLIIIMIFGETGVKMYKDYVEKKKNGDKRD